MFTSATIKRFQNAKFQGLHPQTDVVGMGGSLKTGRFVIIGLICEENRVVEARFRSFNCIPVIAAADWLCEKVKGQSADSARLISVDDILTALGGIPTSRLFCAHIAHEALKAALNQATEKGILQ